MRRDIDTLRLIVEFCDEISDDIQRFGTDIEDFLDDKAYQMSATFSMEQIGELVKRLSYDLMDEFDDVDWHEIAKMRDFVAHRYQHVVQPLLWESMNTEVPVLRTRCAQIIDILESRQEDSRPARSLQGPEVPVIDDPAVQACDDLRRIASALGDDLLCLDLEDWFLPCVDDGHPFAG